MKKITWLFIALLLYVQGYATIFYVSSSGDGTNGTSWATAYTNLKAALTVSVSGDEIWVKQGTYTLATSADQLNYVNGVNVYGGFVGTETDRTQRSTDNSLTIISHNTSVPTNFRLLNSATLATPTTWDGFTFDGNSLSWGVKLSGNCILNNSTIQNCKLYNSSGAGVYMSSVSTTIPVTLSYSTVKNNLITVTNDGIVNGGGAGVCIAKGSRVALVDHCTISGNQINGTNVDPNTTNPTHTVNMYGIGAGLYLYCGSIKNSIFDGNSVIKTRTDNQNNLTAGALAIVPESTSSTQNEVLVEDCSFTNNNSASRGGSILIDPIYSGQYQGIYTFRRCTLANNSTNSVGGGLFSTAASAQTGTGWTLNMENCLISNNSALGGAGGGIYLNCDMLFNATNLTIVKNSSSNYGGGGVMLQSGKKLPAKFYNVVAWGNYCPGRPAEILQINLSKLVTTIENSAIQDYSPLTVEWSPSILSNNINLATTNTSGGPGFVSPSSVLGKSGSTVPSADWKLTTTSPCVNAGSNILSTDINGVARPQAGTSDIGAYEQENTQWTGATNTDWNNAGNWSVGLPTSNNNVVIPAMGSGNIPALASTAAARDLTLRPGAKLTLSSGGELTLAGNLTLESNAGNGSASLVDQGTLTIGGTSYVQQYLSSGRNWYMSSPVADALYSQLSTADQVMSYDETTASWSAVSSGNLTVGKGYVASLVNNSGTITYSGVLNTGDKTITMSNTNGVSKNGFNLIGNPYPSYVDFGLATKTNIEGTMWFRSKNPGNSAYVFDTYNASSGLGTSNNGVEVNSNIPPMQAVWVRVNPGLTGLNATGSIAFTNAMRNHGSSTNKLRVPTESNSSRDIESSENKEQLSDNIDVQNTSRLNQSVIRLKVSNGMNSDETILVFNPEAQNSLDNFDSQKMFNQNAFLPEIFTTVEGRELAINGMRDMESNPMIALGIRNSSGQAIHLSINEKLNISADKSLFIYDDLLKTQQELGVEETVQIDTQDATDRFYLIIRNNVISGIENISNRFSWNQDSNGHLSLSFENNDQKIIRIMDLRANLINQTISSSPVCNIKESISAGMYLVQVQSGNNTQIQKIILK